ncbi:hypothetical protein SNEBB_001430 [Seison nebaliae]|nr:hypothetical protein SNEBB_001430 [Seison nebaliae]
MANRNFYNFERPLNLRSKNRQHTISDYGSSDNKENSSDTFSCSRRRFATENNYFHERQNYSVQHHFYQFDDSDSVMKEDVSIDGSNDVEMIEINDDDDDDATHQVYEFNKTIPSTIMRNVSLGIVKEENLENDIENEQEDEFKIVICNKKLVEKTTDDCVINKHEKEIELESKKKIKTEEHVIESSEKMTERKLYYGRVVFLFIMLISMSLSRFRSKSSLAAQEFWLKYLLKENDEFLPAHLETKEILWNLLEANQSLQIVIVSGSVGVGKSYLMRSLFETSQMIYPNETYKRFGRRLTDKKVIEHLFQLRFPPISSEKYNGEFLSNFLLPKQNILWLNDWNWKDWNDLRNFIDESFLKESNNLLKSLRNSVSYLIILLIIGIISCHKFRFSTHVILLVLLSQSWEYCNNVSTNVIFIETECFSSIINYLQWNNVNLREVQNIIEMNRFNESFDVYRSYIDNEHYWSIAQAFPMIVNKNQMTYSTLSSMSMDVRNCSHFHELINFLGNSKFDFSSRLLPLFSLNYHAAIDCYDRHKQLTDVGWSMNEIRNLLHLPNNSEKYSAFGCRP